MATEWGEGWNLGIWTWDVVITRSVYYKENAKWGRGV